MLKCFLQDDRVNFVDTENVFVGYEITQKCCEYSNFKISDYDGNFIMNDILLKIHSGDNNFIFDKTFFEKFDPNDDDDICRDTLKYVKFRIYTPKEFLPQFVIEQEYYLFIYNKHNGYYAHGFEFRDKDNIIQEGSI